MTYDGCMDYKAAAFVASFTIVVTVSMVTLAGVFGAASWGMLSLSGWLITLGSVLSLSALVGWLEGGR